MSGYNTDKPTAEIIKHLVPSFTVLIIFSCVLLGKGIFPFGQSTIDYYDMGQINVPLYYHAWDWLHGKSALFFDWYINGGQNIAMAASNQWNLSPFILFFLPVPRAYLMKFLSIYVGLHLVGMTAAMQYFLYKMTPGTLWRYRGIFAAAYGLCGYTLTHYTTPTFLDTAVFLPILIFMLFRLLKDGKYIGYSFVLALSIIISYYLGVIDMIYILITGGAYLLLICSKETRPERAGKLVLGTVMGILLSASVTVPVFFSLMKSSRISSNYDDSFINTVMAILRAIGADQYYVKFWQLFAMEAAVIIIVTGLIRFRKERRETLFVFIFFFAPCALVPFESINLIWHLGSYFHYPIRCGYLIPFSLLAAASYFAGKLQPDGIVSLKRIWHAAAAGMASLFTAAALIFFFRHDVWQVETLFKFWLLFAFAFAVLYLLIFLLRSIPKDIFIWFMLSELVVGAAVGYGKPHIYDRFFSNPEQTGAYVETALDLKTALSLEESRLYRIKNPDTSLNANYGIIMRKATVCGWAQTLSRPVQKGAEDFGYSTHFMRILDSGGTVFTDALLGVRNSVVLASLKEKDCLYSLTGEYGDYELYSLKYPFPYINLIPAELIREDNEGSDIVEIHNELYRALIKGCKKDIAAPGELAEWVYKGGRGDGIIRLDEKINGHKLLYLRKGEADKIIVNKEAVPVPSISEPNNTKYPAWFNSNLICLGEFEDTDIVIDCPEKSEIFSLDIPVFKKLSGELSDNAEITGAEELLAAGNKTLTFKINTDSDGMYAVLPVNPDEFSSIKVNGRKAEGRTVNGMLTGVPVESGSNFVEISFSPKGQTAGIIISLIMLLLMGFIYIKDEQVENLIKKSGSAAYIPVKILWFAAVVLIYVIPIAAFIIHQIVKRIF